jgi:hypothetical protein
MERLREETKGRDRGRDGGKDIEERDRRTKIQRGKISGEKEDIDRGERQKSIDREKETQGKRQR